MSTVVADLIAIVRELSLEPIAAEAVRPPHIVVIGSVAAGGQAARALLGASAEPYLRYSEGVPTDGTADLAVLAWAGGPTEPLNRLVAAVRERGWPLLVVAIGATATPDFLNEHEFVALRDLGADPAAAHRAVTTAIDERRLAALGRHLPGLRPAVGAALVERTAASNAQIAALSGVAAVVPIVGTLFALGTDTLVLTRNQLVLVFKLAAVSGRSLEDRRAVYLELVPVIGAAFIWRTVAHQFMALLPVWLGLVPRVSVAYGGTQVVGLAARYYYEVGRVPTADEWRRFYAQATAMTQRRFGRGRAQRVPSLANRAAGAGAEASGAARR